MTAEVTDTKWKPTGAVSSDPSVHVRRLEVLGELRATVVAVMKVSGTDPRASLRTYGDEVLPALRG